MISKEAITTWRLSATFAPDYRRYVLRMVEFGERMQSQANARQFLEAIWKGLGFFAFEPPPTSEPDLLSAPAAIAAFDEMRTDCVNSIDAIHSQCVELPKLFLASDSYIKPALNALTVIARQLAAERNSSARDEVVATSENLLGAAGKLQNYSAALARSLLSLAVTLTLAKTALQGSTKDLIDDVNKNWERVRELGPPWGQTDLRTWLETTHASSRLQMYLAGLLILLQEAEQGAADVVPGLEHLGGYWSAVRDDTQATVDSFSEVVSSPSAILTIGLDALAQSWANTLAESQRLTV